MTCHTGYKTNKGRVKAESEADWHMGLAIPVCPSVGIKEQCKTLNATQWPE